MLPSALLSRSPHSVMGIKLEEEEEEEDDDDDDDEEDEDELTTLRAAEARIVPCEPGSLSPTNKSWRWVM
jgi:hypothetical protein